MPDETNEPTPESTPAPAADTPPAGDDSGGGEPTSDERTMALLAHLLGIVLWFIGPLIIWLIKKDESAFVDDQGKEALNFQLTILIAYVIGIATMCFGVGVLIYLAAAVVSIIFSILAAVQANKGVKYRYPISLRLIK